MTSRSGWEEYNVCIKAFCNDPVAPPIPLPAPEEYGRISGGDQTHIDEVNYSFDGIAGDVVLSYEVWDVDFSDEVEILVNGESVGFAPTTLNEAWGSTEVIILPDSYVDDTSVNLLTFSNSYNPPNIYRWGVRNVQLDISTIPLPAPEEYGRITGGDQTHIDEVNYSFDGIAGDVVLSCTVQQIVSPLPVLNRLTRPS